MGDLRKHGLLSPRGSAVEVSDEHDADEHRDQKPHHHRQGLASVLGLGGTKDGNRVGDHLDPRHGRCPGRECAQYEQRTERLCRPVRRWGRGMKAMGARLGQAGDHDQCDSHHEQVRGSSESGAGLAHPTQVARDQQYDHHQADRHRCGGQRGDRGGDGFHPGGDRYRDGEDVVDDQAGTREQTPLRPEVVAGDDV